MKQIIFNSEQLGRAIIYGTLFISFWFGDSGAEYSMEVGIIILMICFILGGLFLDAMKRLWKYEVIHTTKPRSKKE